MKHALAFAFLTLGFGYSAMAEMTICTGDVCTIEENGTQRRMTTEEVGKVKRQNARTSMQNIECKFAEDPSLCESAMKKLFSLFPY